jgi:hypothetical protein
MTPVAVVSPASDNRDSGALNLWGWASGETGVLDCYFRPWSTYGGEQYVSRAASDSANSIKSPLPLRPLRHDGLAGVMAGRGMARRTIWAGVRPYVWDMYTPRWSLPHDRPTQRFDDLCSFSSVVTLMRHCLFLYPLLNPHVMFWTTRLISCRNSTDGQIFCWKLYYGETDRPTWQGELGNIFSYCDVWPLVGNDSVNIPEGQSDIHC